jgi:hypothetical protein
LFVLPAMVATGASAAIPVTANCADSVDCPPIKRSQVELIGVIVPLLAGEVHRFCPSERVEVVHPTTPVPSVFSAVQLFFPVRVRVDPLMVVVPVPFPIATSPVLLVARLRSPVPFGMILKLSLPIVPIVAAESPPRLRVVESIARVAAASMVASTPAVIVVSPLAVRLVSEAAIVNVLLPESRLRPLVVVAIVAAEPPPRLRVVESIARVAAASMVARFAVVSVVREVEVRLVTPARANALFVVRVPSEVALIAVALFALIVVEERLVVALLTLTTPVPLFGEMLIFPVVFPPRVSVLFRRL